MHTPRLQCHSDPEHPVWDIKVTFVQLLSDNSLLITFLCGTEVQSGDTEVVLGSALQVLEPAVSGTAQIRQGAIALISHFGIDCQIFSFVFISFSLK